MLQIECQHPKYLQSTAGSNSTRIGFNSLPFVAGNDFFRACPRMDSEIYRGIIHNASLGGGESVRLYLVATSKTRAQRVHSVVSNDRMK